MTKLYEVDHEYYCNDGNYFDNKCLQEYKCWSDYLAENRDAEDYYNLIFRWDWVANEDEDENVIKSDDIYYRESTLKLYYMGQRKGLFRIVHVQVCKADEPKVREFLEKKWEYLKTLWLPFGELK